MAQPVAIKYLGSVRIVANNTYNSSDIITAFTGANVLQAKIDPIDNKGSNLTNEFVKVGINGTPMFHFHDGEYCVMASGQSFVFDKDFTAAVGTFVAI